jgi:membrane associated rhomboid family serine protease
MFPIRDTNASRNYPVVNTAIIGINILVYLLQLSQGPEIDRFIYLYGLVPARYSIPHVATYFTFFQQAFSLLSFMFLHGGFFHLLGNMWSLYIFGDNVEDRLGPLRYLLFYLTCGMASGFSHLLLNTGSNIPTIGASGAIAGVMGAYLILHPHSKILTLIPIIIFPWFVEIPAFFFIGIWFILQVMNAAASQGGAGGIAWWAHIGGFIFGILFLKLALKVPSTGMSSRLNRATAKKKSHRLQVIRPAGSDKGMDLYGDIHLTPFEAYLGAQKLVTVPWGFSKRLIKVTVPPGVSQGKVLKLQGLGRQLPDGMRGDLFLKIQVRE